MGLLGWFRRLFSPGYAALEVAVARDAAQVFAAFAAARPGESIYGFAFCCDNDGLSFYVMGNTVEARLASENAGRDQPFLLAELKPGDYFASPADWVFNDPGVQLRSQQVLSAIWDAAGDDEETQTKVFRAMVNGLKCFDASGAFAGARPRDEMVLTLWMNDPDHPKWALDWAQELNPPKAFEWFREGYPYDPEDPEDEEDP